MYIEYTPLEGHLQTILRSPSTSAALLANVEAGDAATQLQVGSSEANVRYRDVTPNAAEARPLDSVPDLAQFSNKTRNLASSADQELRASLEEAQNLTAEEEDEGKYELLDVVDTEEEEGQDSAEEHQLQQNQFRLPYNQYFNIASEEDSDPESLPDDSEKIFIEVEDQDFSYVVTRVCRKHDSPQSLRRRDPKVVKKTNLPSFVARSPLRQRRSVPALRSIPLTVNCRKSSPYVLRQPKSSSGLRLLNGNLQHFFSSPGSEDSDFSSHSSYVYVPRAKRRSNKPYLTQYDNHLGTSVEERYEDFDYVESKTHVKLHNAFPGVDLPNGEVSHSQMGIDIVKALRRLLHLNSESQYDDTNEAKRKRRCDDWMPDEVDAHQIKYRKVDNHFPKFITAPLEDDVIDCFPYPRKPRKPLLLQQRQSDNFAPVAMSQRSSIPSTDKSKRRSIFAPPQTIHRLVKNAAYADLEFSDDDEPELVDAYGLSKRYNIVSKAPSVYNIPTRYRSEDDVPQTSLAAKSLLTDARTDNILSSSLQSTAKTSAASRPLTYADAIKSNLSELADHILGPQTTSAEAVIMPKSGATYVESNGIQPDSGRNITWSPSVRSVLAKEKETEDRDRYQELLRKLVPRIYGTDESASQTAFKATTEARSRSSILAAAASRESPALIDSLSGTQHRERFPLPRRQTSSLRGEHISPWEQIFAQEQSLLRKDATFAQMHKTVGPHPRLSSTTINLVDDEDEGKAVENRLFDTIKSYKSPLVKKDKGVSLLEDNDISEIVDLEDGNLFTGTKVDLTDGLEREREKENEPIVVEKDLPYVEPVNSLKVQFSASPHLKDDWLENWELRWENKKKERQAEVLKIEKEAERHTKERRAAEAELQERLKSFQFFSPDLVIIDDFPEPIEKEPEILELNSEQKNRVHAAINGPPEQVLIAKFNMNITRRDIHTLLGHNWLNDEVINFYMNLLTERGEKRGRSEGLPTVYAMNTFFIPRLLQSGYGAVKRWTRKVDIFARDVIPVPVHVGGVHWCMAILHLKERSIKYYDSMGTPNPSVLKALEQYLKDESMDKRKRPFDTTNFTIESVPDVPRQMNGSDCGVFSCMFAEYVTRNKEITFSQQHMEYFRQKMILEIVQGELLQ